MGGRDKEPRRSAIGVGTASIVLIFVMLCLLTFSVLSLVSAQANLRLSRKSAERTTDYYAAENAANDVLLALEPIMADCAGAEDFPAAVLAGAEAAVDTDFTLEDGNTLCYAVALGEDQALSVRLALSETPLENGKHYRITAWNTVSGYDWDGEQPVKVFQPGAMPGAE